MTPIYYCRRCDLGFCEEHLKEHFYTCSNKPSQQAAMAAEARYETKVYCSVCSGILAPKEPRVATS